MNKAIALLFITLCFVAVITAGEWNNEQNQAQENTNSIISL